MSKKTLLIDCDGVLYPFSQLTLQDFVSAMKKTYREDVGIDGATQVKISEDTLAKNQLGMFNYIKAICNHAGYNFETFCRKMFDRVDYSKITRDDGLYQNIVQASRSQQLIILTNNHIYHLNNVLKQRFGKSVFDFENIGIRCYDITATEKNGVFLPKQNPKALTLLTEKIGVSVYDCVMLDDTPRNIEAAKSIGMPGILIDEDFTLKKYLQQEQQKTLNRGKEYDTKHLG